jgi:WD40 repeat protein
MVQEIMAVDTGDAIAHCCQFDKTGKSVAVGCSDGEVKIVSVDKSEMVANFKCHEGSVNDLVVSQDNSTLITVGGDGVVKTWG